MTSTTFWLTRTGVRGSSIDGLTWCAESPRMHPAKVVNLGLRNGFNTIEIEWYPHGGDAAMGIKPGKEKSQQCWVYLSKVFPVDESLWSREWAWVALPLLLVTLLGVFMMCLPRKGNTPLPENDTDPGDVPASPESEPTPVEQDYWLPEPASTQSIESPSHEEQGGYDIVFIGGGSMILSVAVVALAFIYFHRKKNIVVPVSEKPKLPENGLVIHVPNLPLENTLRIDHEDWKILRKIGSGAYGIVCLAVDNRTGTLFAVKQIRHDQGLGNPNGNRRAIKHLARELKTLSKLDHPNIVKYYGSSNTAGGFCLFLEYVGGQTLHDVISQSNGLELSLIKIYIKQILRGLEYLHENGVIHRDLKPSNILMSTRGVPKLADFGTAYDLNVLSQSLDQTICGTPAFIAPEVIRKEKHTTASDIWSFGVCVFVMLTGEVPFQADNALVLMNDIACQTVVISYPYSCPFAIQEFIAACMIYESSNRLTASELLEHPLLGGVN